MDKNTKQHLQLRYDATFSLRFIVYSSWYHRTALLLFPFSSFLLFSSLFFSFFLFFSFVFPFFYWHPLPPYQNPIAYYSTIYYLRIITIRTSYRYDPTWWDRTNNLRFVNIILYINWYTSRILRTIRYPVVLS